MSDETTLPSAWADLIKGILILARHPANDVSPLHCEHDELYVCAEPEAFADEELDTLKELGFFVSDGGFMSYRFGSA